MEFGRRSITKGASGQQALGSLELLRPGKGSASLERSTSGFTDGDMSSLSQEEVEKFGEFLQG